MWCRFIDMVVFCDDIMKVYMMLNRSQQDSREREREKKKRGGGGKKKSGI
jgi:hypothetical protein